MLTESLWIIIIDMVIGTIQWALLLRFAYHIFVPDNSRLFGIRHINKATNPVIRAFGLLTPDFLIQRIRPLWVGFLIVIIRFYMLPTFIGYEVTALQNLSLEALFLTAIALF